MGKLKVEKKECCENCQVTFDDVTKYYAMNMCQKCYLLSKQGRKKTRVNGKEEYVKCIDCDDVFGSLNKRGKEVVHSSNGLCKTCYSRAYYGRRERNCSKCGNRIQSSTKTICRVCQEVERDEFYKNNPKAKKDASYKQKLRVLQNEITKDQYELIRRLLVKFKVGHTSYADFFRVADIYIDIYSHEAHLDAYNEFDQVCIMLKRLKDIFDHNTLLLQEKAIKEKARLEKEKEKLEKKRKRLLKV